MALTENGKGAQTAFQINYTYFFNPKSGSSFSTLITQGENYLAHADSNSWNLTITHHTSRGENTP
jgi:hypothetical protein